MVNYNLFQELDYFLGYEQTQEEVGQLVKDSDFYFKQILEKKSAKVFLLSAIPNSCLGSLDSKISPLNSTEAKRILEVRGFQSAVGHKSTAELISGKLLISVEENRIHLNPQPGDTYIVALFTPPRRLAEGEKWTEQEILGMPINFIKIDFIG